jgi:hypothetical protein
MALFDAVLEDRDFLWQLLSLFVLSFLVFLYMLRPAEDFLSNVLREAAVPTLPEGRSRPLLAKRSIAPRRKPHPLPPSTTSPSSGPLSKALAPQRFPSISSSASDAPTTISLYSSTPSSPIAPIPNATLSPSPVSPFLQHSSSKARSSSQQQTHTKESDSHLDKETPILSPCQTVAPCSPLPRGAQKHSKSWASIQRMRLNDRPAPPTPTPPGSPYYRKAGAGQIHSSGSLFYSHIVNQCLRDSKALVGHQRDSSSDARLAKAENKPEGQQSLARSCSMSHLVCERVQHRSLTPLTSSASSLRGQS